MLFMRKAHPSLPSEGARGIRWIYIIGQFFFKAGVCGLLALVVRIIDNLTL